MHLTTTRLDAATQELRDTLAHGVEARSDASLRHFELGERFLRLDHPHEAIEAYEACLALRGRDEEAAWACFQLAHCHLALGQPHRAIESCAVGLSRHAGLAELPWLAAFTSHCLGKHAQAIRWARLAIVWGWYVGEGQSIPRSGPRHLPALYEGPYDVLRFALRATGDQAGADEAERHYHAARYARLQLRAEPAIEHDLAVSIHAHYVGRRDEGLQACERLLARVLTFGPESLVKRNRTWYTSKLDSMLPTRFVRLDVTPPSNGRASFSPTVIAHRGGWLLLAGSSTPRQLGEPGEPVNVLMELSPTLEVGRTSVCTSPAAPDSGASTVLLEACRLFSTADGLHVSGTVRSTGDLHPCDRIATARLDPTTATLSDLHLLDAPFDCHERDWMPILGQERWLYHCFHSGRTATVERVSVDGHERWRIELCSPSPRIAKHFRGGSQLVPVDGGWLALVHEVAFDGDRRIHTHRFVRFDDDLAITSWSPPFCFRETRSIEFAAGLALAGNRLVATFGIRDAEAWLVELDLHETLALTRYR